MPHHQYQALSACHINFKIRKFQLAVSTLKQDKPTGCSWKKNIWDHRYDGTYITIIWYVCICHLMSLLQREKEMEASHSSRVWKPHPSAYLFGSPCAFYRGVVHNLLVAKTYLISACTALLLQKDYSIATKWGFMAKKKITTKWRLCYLRWILDRKKHLLQNVDCKNLMDVQVWFQKMLLNSAAVNTFL